MEPCVEPCIEPGPRGPGCDLVLAVGLLGVNIQLAGQVVVGSPVLVLLPEGFTCEGPIQTREIQFIAGTQ